MNKQLKKWVKNYLKTNSSMQDALEEAWKAGYSQAQEDMSKLSNNQDVHTEHCCVNCGCKYMDKNCTVVNKVNKQSCKCGTLALCSGG